MTRADFSRVAVSFVGAMTLSAACITAAVAPVKAAPVTQVAGTPAR